MKDGYKIKPVKDQGRDPVETFFLAERRNKKAGRRLPRTLLSSEEQSLREFWSPFDSGKEETSIQRDNRK